MTPLAILTPNPTEPSSDQIVALFNETFIPTYNTRLVANGEEPIYLPAEQTDNHHRIIFTRDYVPSAMHEIAHWCVAGAERRKLVDFGYWYEPDGRSAEQQALFEKVEVKPQALEWLFMTACGLRFRVSADNLESNLGASDEFKTNIVNQVKLYCEQGVNERAQLWIETLQATFNTGDSLNHNRYGLAELS